jgi:hypothetical protein
VRTELRDKIRHAVLGIGTVRMAERKNKDRGKECSDRSNIMP